MDSMVKKSNYIILLIVIISFFGCNQHCDKYKNLFLENECNVILSKDYTESQPEFMVVEGISAKTGKKCKCQDNIKKWYLYNGYMEKGDTLIKNKGEDFFKIHKKDTVLTIYFGNCNQYNQFIKSNKNPPTTNL